MNDPSPTFHPSAEATVRAVTAEFPGTPFLALGQTALWDEPTKAALRRALDAFAPEARLIAAVHDTDYFAKLPGHPAAATGNKYALVGHDDARTRGLWSAAGEMSRLFGSEDVPTRALLEQKGGVSLHKALDSALDSDALFSELTAAWGWTGIIHTETGRLTVREVPLHDILPALLEQVDWATQGSVECIEGGNAREAAQSVGAKIRGWISAFARMHGTATLSDLYCDLLPRFYELLLGSPPSNLSASTTTRLLRFNRETAPLPRFAFLDLFLNPFTRRAAIDAYNLGVAGSDAYTLDRFGTGALPFDLVVPGKGRGTLCILGDGTVLIETAPQTITLCDQGCNLSSVEQLANLVERELGPEVVLVGKAVTLLPMLAAEFAFVFHEGASGYTDRTHRMLAYLREKGVVLPALRPILRIRHHTWDTLSDSPSCSEDAPVGSAVLRLPEFLCQAFGRETISTDEFAACWQHAVTQEENRLKEVAALRSPRDLLSYLARVEEKKEWAAKTRQYEAARLRLLGVWDRAQALQGRIYTLYDQVRRLRTEATTLEQRKGDDFRAHIQPLREQVQTMLADGGSDAALVLAQRIASLQIERTARFDPEIAALRSQVRYALATVRELKSIRLGMERSSEAITARSTMRQIESEVEVARARLVRNALQTIQGLPHTAYRPSAWWFPLVDPSGAWFRRLTETAEFYLEPLGGER
ncbi:MAG: hypothetical protein H7Z41_12835 [Cytophagales bacterium]|nr:hypothetical protein [Armatimonadota bacterium]